MMTTAKEFRASATTSERIRLLIKERGSPALSSGGSDAFDETVVVAQLQLEPPAVFARRVIDRIAALERSGRRFGSAVVQAGGHHDAASIAARRATVLALAAHARGHGGASELLLDAPADADGPARRELIGLVDQVLSSTQCEAVPVRLRFGSGPTPAPNSGVFWGALEEHS